MHGPAIPVDVLAVGLVPKDDHLRAQLAQHARSGFVGGPVRAVHDDAQPLQGHAARERSLGIFDIAAQRVVDADRLANGVGGRADALDLPAEHQALDLVLDLVI